MENLDKRIQATLVIWVAVGITLAISGMGDASNSSDEIITMVLAAAAFLSTTMVWFLGREGATFADKTASSAIEKAKNNGAQEDARVRLLLELMDEDQKAALRQQLTDELQSDGEGLSLSDLLADQPERRRR